MLHRGLLDLQLKLWLSLCGLHILVIMLLHRIDYSCFELDQVAPVPLIYRTAVGMSIAATYLWAVHTFH